MHEPRPRYRTGNPTVDANIETLIDSAGIVRDEDLVFEILVSTVRMGREAADRGDLKLVNAAMKELRYSFLVFEPYADVRKVDIFGSARTRPDEPSYELARAFAKAMAGRGWMVITGAGPGIMEAGIEGAGAANAFGVNIVLPFEAQASPLLAGDQKLINYRYFFTRKLFFMKESSAFALFPGGFGTMDETFELLTLMQTGRSPTAPIVLVEAPGDDYWESFRAWAVDQFIERGLISEHDLALMRICHSVDEAVDEVCSFYSTYHSQRYVGRRLVLRLSRTIDDGLLEALNDEFSDIVVKGRIERANASGPELDDRDVPELARIAFQFDRAGYARLRELINRLNGR